MRMTLALIFLMILAGCHRPGKSKPAPSEVQKFVMTPLPVPPPLPDPAPVAQDVTGAAGDVAVAQSNVQQVLKAAEATPAAGAAVAPLMSADSHLTTAAQKLGSATVRINDLTQQLAASETAHQNNETILKKYIDTLKTAASKDGAAAAKQVAALEKENQDLQNESIRQAKTRILWAGIALLLGCAGCIAGTFYGFVAGPKLAGFFAVGGVVLIGLSQLLEKIVFWGEVACIGGAVALAGWLVWEAFHHKPLLNLSEVK